MNVPKWEVPSDQFHISMRKRIAELEASGDAKSVKIGRLDDDVMRLTKAVESRDLRIHELMDERCTCGMNRGCSSQQRQGNDHG